jgi:hypothetical protein
VSSVTKYFNIFLSSLIMLETVVDLLHSVVLRKEPFDSCAAGYHGDDTKEKAMLSPWQPFLFTLGVH